MPTIVPSATWPPDLDLRRLVQFATGDGSIWMSGQRMLLVHAAALQAMRRELVGSLGQQQARRLLLRAGFASGERDAMVARQVRPESSLFDAFSVGPQLHMLAGAVQVSPREFEVDLDAGRLRASFQWDHSWEAEAHVRDFGPQTEPVCWMLLGYASGFTSRFFNRPAYFKEVQCSGCGGECCVIEGRFVHEWPDGEALARDYEAEPIPQPLEEAPTPAASLHARLEAADEFGPLIGQSAAFRDAIGLLAKAAPTQVTVLLTGETGVGKERFARAMHRMSARADKPFVAVNCAALPPDLIESELFGAEKGAFTGAISARPGRFERAHGGTVMLDELGELPLTAQAKLLRVLQFGEVERLGGQAVRKIDVRVIAATNIDLEKAVAQGRFRQDLLYRLNVYPIRIPSLRERAPDIELLADYLLQRFMARHGRQLAGFSDRAVTAMRRHSWPGNVRELENLVERAVILTEVGAVVEAATLFPALANVDSLTVGASGLLEGAHGVRDRAGLFEILQQSGLTLEGVEDELIREAVARSGGNLAGAARLLGLTRPQLSYRLSRIQERERRSD